MRGVFISSNLLEPGTIFDFLAQLCRKGMSCDQTNRVAVIFFFEHALLSFHRLCEYFLKL
jgi:hypothetical protein